MGKSSGFAEKMSFFRLCYVCAWGFSIRIGFSATWGGEVKNLGNRTIGNQPRQNGDSEVIPRSPTCHVVLPSVSLPKEGVCKDGNGCKRTVGTILSIPPFYDIPL